MNVPDQSSTPPETQHYRNGARLAVENARDQLNNGKQGLLDRSFYSPLQMVIDAADGAVAADRERMAQVLRNRVLFNQGPEGLPDLVAMRVDEVMLELADQISLGMNYEGNTGSSDNPV